MYGELFTDSAESQTDFLHSISNCRTASHSEQAGLWVPLHLWSYHTENNTPITQLGHKGRNQIETAVIKFSYSSGRSLGMQS